MAVVVEADSVVVEQEEAGNMNKTVVTIVGPTASGKTIFATNLASKIDGEVVSADSRQVYREMDIGTGKDLSDYIVEGNAIPYHLIDIRKPGDKYTVFEFQKDFHNAYQNILDRGKRVILCGGTGLYIESVLKGYNMPEAPTNLKFKRELEEKSLNELLTILRNFPSLYESTDIKNRRRVIRAIEVGEQKKMGVRANRFYPAVESKIIGLHIERDLRRQKISKRLKSRIDEGMIEEVKGIIDSGVSAEDLIYYGLEYRFVTLYLLNEISFEEMYSRLEIAIHQFAKRQMTWFRGMERRGFTIHWIDATTPMEEKLEQAYSFLSDDISPKKL